ncbi:MAG TPA: flagellar hook-basal body complex protein [Acidimicrobiales bacterium]|nr:flagellar hook-basal body complex protein [Acidimicrobiales bacterium]
MEQSLIAAVSGIEANQTYLNVIGNNIANSDTTGYKSQDPVFTDLLAEQIAGASAPTKGVSAGIDPIAVGAGVRVGAVTNDQSQGAIQQTNQPTDVAIQGSGFLVADQQGQQYYTRAGNLTLDANGDLATPTGALIQGWQATGQGVIDPNAPVGSLNIPYGEVMSAQATTSFTMRGNLPAWSGTGTPPVVTTTLNGFDSLGNTVPLTLTFSAVAGTANAWTVQGTVPNGATPAQLWSTAPTITFDPTTGEIGSISGVSANTDGSFTVPVTTMPPGYTFPSGDTWAVTFPGPGSISAVTQFGGEQTAQLGTQNGNAAGTLESFTIGGDGVISGAFSNGLTEPIAQLALATFSNPTGLIDDGNLMYSASANSGQPSIGTAGTGGRGTLLGGALEGSNVDLAAQLTDMIQAQEGYQADAKVVSTTSNTLQALVQMA